MRPLAEAYPLQKRDLVRVEALAKAPRWYNPWVHLAIPSVFGIAVIATSIALVEDLRPLELLTVPIVYLVTNMNEWHIHRDLLHRRSLIAPILYDRHTPQHHLIYMTDDMAMRDRREFRLVLIPAYALFLIFVSLLPLATFFWFAIGRNIALLYTATAMGYAVSYEWLHLSYHLPSESWIGSLRAIRFLRRHHAVHHDPRLMQRWNFNVTLPFWDWVRGTTVADYDALPESIDKLGSAAAPKAHYP